MQSKKFLRTLLTALRQNVANHPRTCDEFTNPLTYEYNTHPYSGTRFDTLRTRVSKSTPHSAIELRWEIIRKDPSR